MNVAKWIRTGFGIVILIVVTGHALDAADEVKEVEKTMDLNSQTFFNSLVGNWEGSCKTWFQPGRLADESEIEGEFMLILNGNFLRHTYRGKIQGKARKGEETIAFNTMKRKFQVSWFDDFHMSYGILFSEGDAKEKGFVVSGKYYAGPGQDPWGWKTVYELIDKDHLTITAYNVTPDGTEAKAVETQYARKTKE